MSLVWHQFSTDRWVLYDTAKGALCPNKAVIRTEVGEAEIWLEDDAAVRSNGSRWRNVPVDLTDIEGAKAILLLEYRLQ